MRFWVKYTLLKTSAPNKAFIRLWSCSQIWFGGWNIIIPNPGNSSSISEYHQIVSWKTIVWSKIFLLYFIGYNLDLVLMHSKLLILLRYWYFKIETGPWHQTLNYTASYFFQIHLEICEVIKNYFVQCIVMPLTLLKNIARTELQICGQHSVNFLHCGNDSSYFLPFKTTLAHFLLYFDMII